MPVKIIAASVALSAFVAAILAGLAAGNPAHTILWHALLAMAGCWVVGAIVGVVAFRAVQEHVERYKLDHPVRDPRLLAMLESDAADAAISPIQITDEPAGANAAPTRRPHAA